MRATQTVVAREAIIALCTGNKKTVRATRADNEKTSEKPPNPRRGTSLKKKIGKDYQSERQNLFEDRAKLNQA